MSEFPKSEEVDIMIFSEGTYPYIKGGVSEWIYRLMNGLPEFRFGICFIGGSEVVDGKKMEISYDFPKNLVHLQTHWIFDFDEKKEAHRREGSKEGFEAVAKLHAALRSNKDAIPKELEKLDFYLDEVTFEDFLYSMRSWEYIQQQYLSNCPEVPFIDYFWTVRNIHKPIWILAQIAKTLPKAKLYHAPSTGYAGFLAALSSYDSSKPFLLSEHGIYTRERKIELLAADWVAFNKPHLLQEAEEYNYVKKMWIDFFDKIGLFCYNRANYIFSLFSEAREIQIDYGADANRCRVIPNGVKIEPLRATMQRRADPPKPVISLIGRVVPIKDIKTFIRAIKIATIQNPQIEGWVVGPVEEDPDYVRECQQMAIALGLNSEIQEFEGNKSKLSHEELERREDLKIKFFGHSDVKEIFPKSALQTLTSISEGMPLVILEGFAAGVPCVATDVGSCRDLVYGGIEEADKRLGKAGEITGIADPDALARSYLRLLEFENGLWLDAQKVALQRVERYYKEEMMIDAYRHYYQEGMGRSWEELYDRLYMFIEPVRVPCAMKKMARFEIVRYVTKPCKETEEER